MKLPFKFEWFLPLKCFFKMFAFIELISFNSIYAFIFLFSSISLKQLEAIQVFRFAEFLLKRVLTLFGEWIVFQYDSFCDREMNIVGVIVSRVLLSSVTKKTVVS